MPKPSNCAVCNAGFGIFLHRYQCVECERTVCDDCAPKQDGKRECRTCVESKLPSAIPTDSAGEREKRLRAIEERQKAMDRRGRPQGGGGGGGTRVMSPSPSLEQKPSDPNGEKEVAAQRGHETREADPSASAPNPVLEAAMRRRQQGLEKNTNRGNSLEKAQLLAEITAVLKTKGEEEPFGLRSMDEVKLRSYLRYIKEKGSAPRGD